MGNRLCGSSERPVTKGRFVDANPSTFGRGALLAESDATASFVQAFSRDSYISIGSCERARWSNDLTRPSFSRWPGRAFPVSFGTSHGDPRPDSQLRVDRPTPGSPKGECAGFQPHDGWHGRCQRRDVNDTNGSRGLSNGSGGAFETHESAIRAVDVDAGDRRSGLRGLKSTPTRTRGLGLRANRPTPRSRRGPSRCSRRSTREIDHRYR